MNSKLKSAFVKILLLSLPIFALSSNFLSDNYNTKNLLKFNDELNEEEVKMEFEIFINFHQKKYENKEKLHQSYINFKNNFNKIKQFRENTHNSSGDEYQFPIMSDISEAEFLQNYITKSRPNVFPLAGEEIKLNLTSKVLLYKDIKLKQLPDHIDWREKGAVTPVKSYGASFADSAIGNIEGLLFLRDGILIPLSKQQIIDCDEQTSEEFASTDNIFEYINKQGGLESEKDYSFTGQKGICKFDAKKVTAKILGYELIDSYENIMMQTVYFDGPISVEVNALPLQFYSGGIYRPTAKDCDPKTINHGMLIVGYGIENEIEFWIVKNSWGENWGENGYLRIERNIGACGINLRAISARLK